MWESTSGKGYQRWTIASRRKDSSSRRANWSYVPKNEGCQFGEDSSDWRVPLGERQSKTKDPLHSCPKLYQTQIRCCRAVHLYHYLLHCSAGIRGYPRGISAALLYQIHLIDHFIRNMILL